MSNGTRRPPVRITFRFNVDTGVVEEFIVDDDAPTASEAYHNQVARLIVSSLARRADILDAGPVRFGSQVTPAESPVPTTPIEEKVTDEP